MTYAVELIKKADREPIKPFSEEEYKQMKRTLKNRKAPDTQGWRYELIKYAGEDLEMLLGAHPKMWWNI